MVKILIACLAAYLLSFLAGCGIGRLCRVGSSEDLYDLQAEDADFNGAALNTPLPNFPEGREANSLVPRRPFPMSGMTDPESFQA